MVVELEARTWDEIPRECESETLGLKARNAAQRAGTWNEAVKVDITEEEYADLYRIDRDAYGGELGICNEVHG